MKEPDRKRKRRTMNVKERIDVKKADQKNKSSWGSTKDDSSNGPGRM